MEHPAVAGCIGKSIIPERNHTLNQLIYYLKHAVAECASDIFFVAGGPVSEKRDGHILPLEEERLLPPDTRKVLITPALQAVFATAETHGTRLLGAMNLAHLAEEQLIAMDSAHLERVVRGFAGHYLVHIENRGWMGAVFALPGMLIYLF